MNFDLFPIQLIPATKNSSIHLWNNTTKEIIEGGFSRATPPGQASSGSTVFDRDGNLVELGENIPDWSFKSGTPVIEMRPQIENKFPEYKLEPVGSTRFTYTGLSVNGDVMTEDSSTGFHRLQYGFIPSFSLNTQYVYGVYVKNWSENRNLQMSISNGSTGDIVTRIFNKNGTSTGSINVGPNWSVASDGLYDLGNGNFLIWATGQTSAGTSHAIRLSLISNIISIYTGDGESSIEVVSFQAQVGSVMSGIIPGTLTRGSNSFSFTDLVTKGVTSVNGFSVLIDLQNFRYNTVHFPVYFKNGTTNIFTILSNSPTTLFLRAVGNIINIANIPTIVTVSGGILTAYQGSTVIVTAAITNNEITSVVFENNNSSSFDIKRLYFTPIVLTEAESRSILNNL